MHYTDEVFKRSSIILGLLHQYYGASIWMSDFWLFFNQEAIEMHADAH